MPIGAEIRVKDTTGMVVTRLTDWIRFEWENRQNGLGFYVLETKDEDPVTEFLTVDNPDYQIELYRYDIENAIASYLEFEGLHRTPHYQMSERGEPLFLSYGRGYLDLVRRRVIMYRTGQARTQKDDPSETVIKEFVEESCAASATVAGGRLRDGVQTGFTVQATAGLGDNWEGSKSMQLLLPLIQSIAEETGVDFRVVGTGAALFSFQVRADPWGEDRTTQGLDPATGLNAAGNTPVIFGPEFNNTRVPQYLFKRVEEQNVVAVLGQGVEDEREVVLREDAVAGALSPWNDIEFTRQANQLTTTQSLQDKGDEELTTNQAREEAFFDPIQVNPWLYGRDYFVGDRVTFRYPLPNATNVEVDKKILAVRGTLVGAEGFNETLNIELADVL